MTGAAKSAGARTKAHQPAAAGAATAQGAAAPPGNEVASKAAAAQVDEMGNQQPGVFDRKAFIAAVKKAIDATAPKNLEEADDFKGSGKAGKAKDEVQGIVKGGKKESEKNIKQATDAPPDTSKATPKPVTPMVNDEPGAPPAGVGAAAAMPGPRPPEHTDLSAGPAQVDSTMAEAGVTDEQIKKSNEPEFGGALEARDAAAKHSATAPGEYRAQEQDIVAKGRADAEGAAGEQLAGMHGARAKSLGKAVSKKEEAKSADESKRSKVAADIQAIYTRTKGDVTKILEALDGKVDAAFTKGEQAARTEFETYVDEQMRAYKADRYDGWTGGLKWAKDKLFGMPDEVNRFYEQGRVAYLAAMDGVIGEVATIVGEELTAARARITEGRAEVQKYVAKLPDDLREVGKEAEGKLNAEFDQLSSEVDSKQDALVDTLAQKYVESRNALDSRIEELQAANKGLVDKALDAVVGVVKTILKLKDMLLNVLAKAASVIGDIISDPIGFLGNLINGVMGGLNKFVDNIGTHLQQGLMGWLFGALGSAGLTMPKALDFAGILDLVLQILGLTYQNIRGRIAKVIGEPLVAKMEQTVDVIKDFATKGIAGAWEWIKDKIGDLEDMVLGQIKEFVTSKIIKAGITWIISLLNPAAAFIKACKAIYDIVMFIVERGSEIMEFVNSIIDSIGAIAKGSIGVAVEKVEGALARALPLAISFLASLLNLGGISDKIRSIIDAVRGPINKAIDVVVGGAVKVFKKMFGGAIGWAKGKFEKGKAFVKGTVEAGKAFVKGKVDAGKAYVKGKVKGAAGWIKEKLGIVKAEKGFTDASGESHELTATGEGEHVEVTMASSMMGRFTAKLSAARKQVEAWAGTKKLIGGKFYKKDEMLAKLDDALAKADVAALDAAWYERIRDYIRFDEHDMDDTDPGVIVRKTNEWRRESEARLAAAVVPLQQIPDFGMLRDDPNQRRFLPSGYKVRGNLYQRGKSWTSTRHKVKGRDLDDRRAILKSLDVAKGTPDEAHTRVVELMTEWVGKGWIPGPSHEEYKAPATLADEGIDYIQEWIAFLPYDVDHDTPLAHHWNQTGHNSDDASRIAATHDELNDQEHLSAMFFRSNRSKGSEDETGERATYRREVGPDFISTYAEAAMRNAQTIDDLWFCDESGTPLNEKKP